MVVTVFRARLRPENVDAYADLAPKISALAKTMPGYISHKGFVADDGERVSDRYEASPRTRSVKADAPGTRSPRRRWSFGVN